MTGRTRVLSEFHDSLEDGVYVFADDELVDANARVGDVAGKPTTAMLGQSIQKLLREWGANDSADDALEAYERVANGTTENSRADFELIDSTGTIVPVDARFTRKDEYVIAVVRNYAEIREREDALKSLSDQLEVLNRVLRHDIRNDMNVVQGWLRELEDHLDDDGRAALRNVEDAVAHTLELTTEARDLAKVVTRGGDIPVEPVAIDRVLHQQVAKARTKYPEATVRVDGDVPSVRVVGNEMLSSVFDNLLGNAVVHNDRDEPTVTIDVTVRDDRADSAAVVVRVIDDGPGIPEGMKGSLFGRGMKGVDSPGTGMGLYLVDQLVSGYGGTVRVEPNEPRGSVFVVTLPVADD